MKLRIREESIVLIIVVLILIGLIATVFIWSYNRQKVLLKNDLEDKASILTEQLNATRHFIAKNQDKINYSKGQYEYKNLNPEKVAMEIADILSIHTKYKIKLASLKPRNPRNKADAFEKKQIMFFDANKKSKNEQAVFEEYAINGVNYYRYVKPIYMSKYCINCHGVPKGEPDKSGYPKEGYKIGDIAGAVSIILPTDSMDTILRESTKKLFLFLLIVGFITIGSVYLLTRRLVVLTKEVETINTLLSKKNEELLSLEKVKSDLTHMIVHDFRGTLANIMGYLSLLVDEHIGTLNKSQKEFSEAALINSKKLLNMAADLLDINKLEEDRMPVSRQSVNLEEIFEEKEDFWSKSALLENKTVEVSWDNSISRIHTDKNILERILDNLVYNAIKHTAPGKGKIIVTVGYGADKSFVTFKVSDNGEGIPQKYVDKVFDKFFQVEAAKTKRTMGVGLGLTFCKMAVEALGGVISLESGEGKGTTVKFSLSAENTKK